MDSFQDLENRNGVRLSWHAIPTRRSDAARLVVPIGAMYQVLKKTIQPLQVPYDPIRCSGGCRSFLNPYCSVDIESKQWTCEFCKQRNQFPPHYHGMTPEQLPAELYPAYSTIEYIVNRNQAIRPIFLFVIDLAIENSTEKELQALKDSLLGSLNLIPENALVGLITFGATVQVYELAFEHFPKAHVFRGNKVVTPQNVREMLDLPSSPGAAVDGLFTKNRFVVPLADCKFTLETIIEELQRDPQVVNTENRFLRATGVAVAVACGLLENLFTGTGARIMTFATGPCTVGPGIVVPEERSKYIRVHKDIVKEKAPLVKKATTYYDTVGKRASALGFAFDIFCCSLDQIGLLEMRGLCKHTGGLMVNSEGFAFDQFRKSFRNLWARDPTTNALKIAFNGTLEVVVSKDLRVAGAIGNASNLKVAGANIAKNEVGMGGTSVWKLCGLDPQTTVSLYFDISERHGTPLLSRSAMFQFITSYQNSLGQRIMRITTISQPWADQMPQIGPGFDQETAAALIARIAIFKSEEEETTTSDVVRWLDRMLIRLCAKFGSYNNKDPASFGLEPHFTLFPQFMFYLRRSHFLQVFGDSPDETTYYRYMANRETVSNVLIMIQPTLDSYKTAEEPQPVLLSASSLAEDSILVCDTYFQIIVHSGNSIVKWRNSKFHLNPEYASFKTLLERPMNDAQAIANDRLPVPRIFACDQGKSKARYLYHTIDPDVTHHQNPTPGAVTGEVIFSDDVSLSMFMVELRKLAVAYTE